MDLYDEDEVWLPRKLRRLKFENGKGGAGYGKESERKTNKINIQLPPDDTAAFFLALEPRGDFLHFTFNLQPGHEAALSASGETDLSSFITLPYCENVHSA